jgi:tRNA A-37 threonylcarbamoyl transferase component Bud32
MTPEPRHPEAHSKTSTTNLNFKAFVSDDGWQGLVNNDWEDILDIKSIDEWMARQDQESLKDVPCRIILKASTKGGIVYTKYMRAQNDGVIKKRETFPKIKWTLSPSRALRILNTTAKMISLGHLAPTPVLAARKRMKFGYPHEIFIAEEVALDTAEDIFYKASDNQKLELMEFCGKTLAKLHRDGFIHGDYLPRNICPDAKRNAMVYLDNDRTKFHRINMPFFLKRRNLAQFSFNLYLLAENPAEDCVKSLVLAYGDELGWKQAKVDGETNTILRQVAKRWEKTKFAELKRKHLAENR